MANKTTPTRRVDALPDGKHVADYDGHRQWTSKRWAWEFLRRKLYNLETTSGAGFSRDVWMRQQFLMTDEALSSGIYMRPLTKKETAVVMVGTLLEFYEQHGLDDQVIRMADLAYQYSPKDVSIILAKRHAYFMLEKREFIDKYSKPASVPLERRPQLAELDTQLKGLYDQAYALGWRPPDAASEESYLKTVSRAKSEH